MKRRMIALLLALLMLALTGCGNWDTSELEDPLRDLTDYYEKKEEEETPVLTAFTLPYFSNQTLDPITCPDGAQLTLGALLYEGLFALDEQFSVQNVLARSYSYDADTFTYTIKVRSDIRFSDGSRLSAYDVADTLQRARSSERYRARLAMVNSLYAEDSDTVSISLSQDNRCFTARLDIPIVKSGTESELIPTGTGPYCWQTDDGTYLGVNSHWWQEKTLPLERIELLDCRNTDTMVYSFYAHEVQLLALDLTGTNVTSVSGSGNYTDAASTVMQYIGFNTTREPFNSAALRQAIHRGVDRVGMLDAYLLGHADAAQFPLSPRSDLYPADIETSYSPDYFASAMAAAGYNKGVSRPVTMLVNEENAYKVSMAQQIAKSLSRYDLKVTVSVLPWEQYLYALQSGNFDLYYGEVKLTADWDISSLVLPGGSLNYGGYNNENTAKLLSAYLTADDDTKRAKAMDTLCRHLADQVPFLPVCFKNISVLLPSGAVEAITPTAANPFYNMTAWKVNLSKKK